MGRSNRLMVLVVHHLVVVVLLQLQHSGRVDGEAEVPCVFVFGDSLSDSGNNNQLQTYAKANYFPYGFDFPSGPTGRFTNGRTTLDIITELLGFENYIPPFANTSGSNILLGVNYASGASGIRNETGTAAGAIISLPEQMRNHRVIVSEIERIVGGAEEAKEYLKQCLYYVNIGSNDYLNNYFLPQYFPTSKLFSPQDYALSLIQDYAHHLRAMHEVGGRKFALFGLHLLGCVPIEIVNRGDGSNLCVEEDNKVALLFNDKLRALVDEFNAEFSDSKFIFVNSALISSQNPLVDGIRSFSNTGCCQVEADGMCIPNQTPCVERDLHLFFDLYHPTQAANHVLATLAFKNLVPSYTHPMDISDLVHFQL